MEQRLFVAAATFLSGMGLIYAGMIRNGAPRQGNPAWELVSGFWTIVGVSMLGLVLLTLFILILMFGIEIVDHWVTQQVKAAERNKVTEMNDRVLQAPSGPPPIPVARERPEAVQPATTRDQSKPEVPRSSQDVIEDGIEQIIRGY